MSQSTNSSSGSDIAFVAAESLRNRFHVMKMAVVCELQRAFDEKSFEQGTVLIRCPACSNYHAIAVNIFIYYHITAGRKTVEEMAKEKGIAFAQVNAERLGQYLS